MTFDHNNPLVVSLPYSFATTSEYPTEILANRFQAWRSIIKDLVNYLKEYASVQEEIVRQQLRLQQAVGTSASTIVSNSTHQYSHKEDLNAINKFFLPIGNGSVQDLPTILTKFHQLNFTNTSKTLKELNTVIIPKLDELRKDLLLKIKEIKNLQNDFKSNVGKELTETKHLLGQFNQAIEHSSKSDQLTSSSQHDIDNGKNDPYIAKIKLDRQIKKQLSEENYLYEAYANLQNAGGKLESIVVLEIQNYLSLFLNLLHTENLAFPEFLFPNLNNGFLAKESAFEWDSFIARNLPNPHASTASTASKNGSFIDLSFPARKISDIKVPHFDSPLNLAVREGYLERRSKFLKSYSSGWYVLTCNYLHEFKNSDHKKDPQPVMSLPLDFCTVTEHSKDDGKAGGIYKFILSSKSSNGLMHRSHNWVFRTNSYKGMMEWYNDLKKLTSFSTPIARAKYISRIFTTAGENESSKRISRGSSLKSYNTHANSIKTVSTRNTARSPTKSPVHAKESVKSGLISPSASVLNTSRLSSSFSHTLNQSPRLGNMINSDGTIITPVDTYDDKKSVHTTNKQNHLDRQQNATPIQNQQSFIPAFPQSQSPFPQVAINSPHSYPPNVQQGEYVPANQVHQIYDPVQQQYYIIAPSVPGIGQGQYIQQHQQNTQQPQPQYFQPSPQNVSQQQVYPLNTANYFPQYPNQLNEPIGGGKLPYPTNGRPSTLNSNTSSIVPDDVKNEEIETLLNGVEKDNQEEQEENNVAEGQREEIIDEVETLRSDPQDTTSLIEANSPKNIASK